MTYVCSIWTYIAIKGFRTTETVLIHGDEIIVKPRK